MSISNKLGKLVLASTLALGMVGAGSVAGTQTASAATTISKKADLGVGIQFLANGKGTVDGSAYDGLTLTSSNNTSGTLNFHYSGQAFGIGINHESSLAVQIPAALQPLFSSPDFAEKYIQNASFVSGSNNHQYTQDKIKVSGDGSTLFIQNPQNSFLIAENIAINFNIDIGQAVSDTNIRIADDTNDYPFTMAFTDATSWTQLDWSIFPQDQTSTVTLGTDQLDPGYKLFKAPNVQPVNDQDTEVRGVAIPNAAVRVYRGRTLLGTTNADDAGYYSIEIPKQNADVTLTVVQNAGLGDSQSAQVVVSHEASELAKPTITQPVTAGDQVVKGTGATAGNQVFLVRNGTVIGSDYVHTNGSWEITLNEGVTLTAEDAIGVYQQNSSGDKSDTAYVGVKEAATVEIPAPGVGLMSIDMDTLTGTGTTDGNTITVKKQSSGETWTTTVKEGKWSVKTGNLSEYTILLVTESDAAGNKSPEAMGVVTG